MTVDDRSLRNQKCQSEGELVVVSFSTRRRHPMKFAVLCLKTWKRGQSFTCCVVKLWHSMSGDAGDD